MPTPTASTRTADAEADPDPEGDPDREREIPPHHARLNHMCDRDRDPPGNHVLEPDDVLAARFCYMAGLDPEKPHASEVTQAELADRLGCDPTTLRLALVGETWQHVAGPVYDPESRPRTLAATPNERFPTAPWLPPVAEGTLRRAAARGEDAETVAERLDDDRVTAAVVERWAGRYGVEAFA